MVFCLVQEPNHIFRLFGMPRRAAKLRKNCASSMEMHMVFCLVQEPIHPCRLFGVCMAV